MDDSRVVVDRASKFNQVIWLQAVCYAAVVGIITVACLFLGSMLHETIRSRLYVEAAYVILFGACATGLTEFIGMFVHAEMMGEVNYFPKLLKTTAAAFVAFVAAGIVLATAGIVTKPYAERIVVVLVLVVGLLFLLSAIISLSGDISFRKCVLVINLGGTSVACLCVGISLLFTRLRWGSK